MTFINEQIFPEELPLILRVEWLGLEKAYRQVMYLNRGIAVLVWALLYFGAITLVPYDFPLWTVWTSGLILGIGSLASLATVSVAFRIKAYALRQKDILYRSGLINRHTTVVPFNRVQHIEIKTSPIDRWFGISRLRIYTAGGSQSDLSIPGLRTGLALQLKEAIIAKTATDEEE